MTPNNRALALLTGALFLATASAAHATLAVAAPFDQKVDNAVSIFLGKCVKTESRMDPSGRWILTYSTFQIEKTMKGDAAPQITIVTPGGSVGTLRQDTVGIPEFSVGDENVIFVKNSQVGPTVLYFDQGAYDVTNDAHGDKIIAPVQSSLVTIDTQRGVAVPAEQPRTLKTFEENVGRAIAAGEKRHIENELVAAKRRQQASAQPGVLWRYRYWFAAAVLGAALATWQLMRR